MPKSKDALLPTGRLEASKCAVGGEHADGNDRGLKLAERGGRSGKKRAIVATARKLAVLLHHLWVSGEVYEPLHNNSRVAVTAAA
jgi:transposase